MSLLSSRLQRKLNFSVCWIGLLPKIVPPNQAEAQARIDSQMPLSEKVKYADFVIENDGTASRSWKERWMGCGMKFVGMKSKLILLSSISA